MIGYLVALLPLYILVWLPISHMIFGPSETSSDRQTVIFNSSFVATDEPLSCPPHSYNTFILSQEPLIIYIENFLSADESAHLIKISEDKFAPSTVSTGAETSIQKDIRYSEVALIDRDDVVRCVEHRARDFQGWRPDIHIERLRTQRYGTGGHYKHHFDWSGGSREADRVSTFMVYVDADCEGGGTQFPRIRMPNVQRGRWCEFLECGKSRLDGEYSDDTGVTFKPIKGNAVFWENLGPDGRGYEQTFHAGLPVKSGTKIGLNIWSWGPARRSELFLGLDSRGNGLIISLLPKMASPLPGRASADHDYQERPSTSFSAIGRRRPEHSNFTTTAEFEAYSKNPLCSDRPVNLTSRIGTIRKIRSKATFESPLPSVRVAPVVENCAKLHQLPSKIISTTTDRDRDTIRKALELDTAIDETGPEKPLTLELVYSIRQNKFYHVPRSILLPREPEEEDAVGKGSKRLGETPVYFEVRDDDPPVLCDGRVAMLKIPRWRKTVKFYWRLSNGEVLCRRIVLPHKIWVDRNIFGFWKEVFVERG